MQRFRQTGNVTDRSRAGRPRKTTPREARLISRRVRQRSFSTTGALRGNLAFGGHISTHTVIRRLHHKGMRARCPIKRPQLTLRHRHARFAHGDGSTGLMKVVFCYVLTTVVEGFGANETLHFRTTTFWAQLLLGLGVQLPGVVFPLTLNWIYTFLMVIWQAKNTVTMCSLHA
jgi:hypothetical protein